MIAPEAMPMNRKFGCPPAEPVPVLAWRLFGVEAGSGVEPVLAWSVVGVVGVLLVGVVVATAVAVGTGVAVGLGVDVAVGTTALTVKVADAVIPVPALASICPAPAIVLGTVNVFEMLPLLSEETLPRLTLPPLPFNVSATLVPAGRKLLPVTVACCPAVTVAGETASCGCAFASRVNVLLEGTGWGMLANWAQTV